MASPAVQTTNESATTTAGTSHTVNLPSGIQSNDLLIVCLDKGSTAATVNALEGWTELLDENAGNGLYIAYKFANGTESGTITLTTSASTRSAEVVLRISGAENPAVQAPVVGTTATGTSTTPNPPSITPPSSKDYLFIAMCGSAGEQADDDTYVTTFPTNYSHSQNEKTCGIAGSNLGGLVGVATRQLTTGVAEDPGTFTVSENAAWRAQTVIIHPASPAVPLPELVMAPYLPANSPERRW